NPGGNPTTISNVAAGELSATSTDAVNGSQLYETNQNVTQLGNTFNNIAGDTSQANTDANGLGIRYARTNEAGLTPSDSSAQGQGSTAVGYNATATADSALALGREAQASHASSVALGANSVADGSTLGMAAYNPGTGTIAGTVPVGEVSVGSAGNERRVTNVAAGAQASDAVNVSQLQSVATNVNNLGDRAVQYDGNVGDAKDTITLAGTPSTDGGVTGGTRITNVSQGELSATSTDAVNGAQLNQTNENVARNTSDIAGIGDTITTIAGDTSQANRDANGLGIRYVRTNEAGLAPSDSSAQGQGSTAVGYNATATADSALALGREARASHAGSVALGANSVADGSTLSTGAYNPGTGTIAGTAPVGEVSVGSAGTERRVTNVAAGAVATDAVNVSQLQSVATNVNNLGDRAVQYDGNVGDAKDTITLAGTPSTDGGATGGTRITNMSQGELSATSTDAVNGSQLYETNQNVTQLGDTLTNITGDTSQSNTDANGLGIRYVRTNEAGLTPSDSSAQGQGSTAVGYNATATADSALALGREAQASHAGSVALGANSVADGSTLGMAAYNPSAGTIAGATPVGEVSVGSTGNERRVTNVAAGAVATDAVNVSQLQSVATNVDNLGDRAVQYDGNVGDAKDTITLAGTPSTDGGATGGTRITNVSQGELSPTSTDAVNGAQLNQTNENVARNTSDIAGIGDTITTIAGDTSQANTDANGLGIRYVRTNEAGLTPSDASAQGQGSTAVGYNATATADSALALGREAQASHAGSVALGANSVADGSTLGVAAYNPGTGTLAGTAPVGEVSVGSTGNERRVTNVAAGAAASDAVNVSQLQSVATNVNNLGDRAVQYDGNVGDAKDTITLAGTPSTDGGATGGTRITNVSQGELSATSTDAVNGAQLNQTNENVARNTSDIAGIGDTITTIAGDTSQANTDANGLGIRYARTNEAGLTPSDSSAQGQGSTAVGYNATATAESALALGREAQASHAGSVALGANSIADGSTLGMAAYNPGTGTIAGTVPVGEVSVGSAGTERRVTNVAAGAQASDAVNVSQLQSVATNVNNLGDRAVQYDGNVGDAKDTITLAGTPSTDGGATGGTRITNVSQGELSATSTDAVNGAQLNQTNENVTALDGRVTTVEGNVTQLGDTLTTIAGDTSQANTDANGLGIRYVRTNEAGLTPSDSSAQGQGSTAVGYNATATAESALALGREAQASHAGSVALGANSVADGSTLGMAAYNPGTGALAGTAPVGEVSVGSTGNERRITNVAAGATDTDAVNVSQLKSVEAGVGNVSDRAVKYDGNVGDAKDTITLAGTPSTDGGATGGTRITNVSQGELSATSTDAVNGAQLHQTNENVTALDGRVTTVEGNVTQLGDTLTTIAGDTSQANTDANGLGVRYVRTNDAGLAPSDSSAQGQGSTAVGYNATATADSALALGREARASHAGSVALGANSVADGSTLGMAAYNPGTGRIAGTAPVGEVSVGSAGNERRITNVAAGATDTDAVNVSQLKAVETSVGNVSDRAVKYDGNVGDAKDTITLAGAPSTDGGATGGTRITNVSQGELSATSTDAVNGAQLYETNRNVAQNASDIAGIGDTITTIAGDTSQANTDVNGQGIRYVRTNEAGLAPSDSSAQGQGSTAVGYDATATGDSALAVGRQAQAGKEGSVAVGANAVADGVRSVAVGNANTVTGDGALAIGNGNTVAAANAFVLGNNVSLTNTNLNGAVVLGNGSTASAAAPSSTVTINGVTYVYAGGAPAAGDVVSVGSGEAPRQIQNVAAGRVTADSLDAINGSQLFATNLALSSLGDTVNRITTGGFESKYYQANGGANSEMPAARATGTGSAAMGPAATATGTNSVAAGNGAEARKDGDVALGAGAVADRGAESYTGQYSGAQNRTAGTVSVGAAGAERTISNVADGRNATDAVNLRQLEGAVKEANAYTDQRIDEVAGTVVEVGETVDRLGDRVTTVEGDVTKIRQGADGMFQVNQGSTPPTPPQASGGNSVAGGSGAVASGQNATAVGNNARASGENSTAVGNGANASGNNSVAVGANSTTTRDDTVSVGAVGQERQVINVAAGREGTDAVNVNQLREAERGINQQMSGMRRDLQYVDARLSAGVAAAMAMSALPQAYSPGKSMVSLGGATWRGQSGIAMGISTVSDNGKWVIKGLASSTSRGDYGAAVGVGFQW
ncbi:YadA-like family protein, partial [Pigmentiphaga sp. YJ18]|uniref:YadA-like family protein n=1 Tax=Pigmentiphaga sp. YJ18 TaxID=3134907 RepID=UPI004053D463